MTTGYYFEYIHQNYPPQLWAGVRNDEKIVKKKIEEMELGMHTLWLVVSIPCCLISSS